MFPSFSKQKGTEALVQKLSARLSAHPLKSTPLQDIVWMAFDMETNSLDYRKAVPLSIAVLPVTTLGYQPGQVFSALIRPNKDLVRVGASIHQLMPEQLSQGKPEGEILEALLDWLPEDKPLVWVGHHVRFDYEILQRIIQRHASFKWKPAMVCTASMAIRLRHGIQARLENMNGDFYKLENLVAEYGLPGGARHSACSDAAACAQILLHQLAILHKQEVTTLGQLMAYGKPIDH